MKVNSSQSSVLVYHEVDELPLNFLKIYVCTVHDPSANNRENCLSFHCSTCHSTSARRISVCPLA